jgi:hypothetical protein
MKKKIAPRYGWTGSGGYHEDPISEKAFGLLAASINQEAFSPITKSEIREIARKYRIRKSYLSSRPKLREIKAGLEEIKEKSKALIDCLQIIDKDTLEKLAGASPNAELFDILDGHTDAHRIYFAAKKALEILKSDKGGRPREFGLKDCINELAGLFEKIKGKPAGFTKYQYNNENAPFQGLFFEFVQAFLKIVDDSVLFSNTSLGKQIEKTFKLRKTSNQ